MKKLRKTKSKARVIVDSFSNRFLINPKKLVECLVLEIPARSDSNVNTFLARCWKAEESLVLRSVFSSSSFHRLVFIRKKDMKNIDELKLKLENFHKNFIPGAEK